MSNVVSYRLEYLKSFKCVQRNNKYLMKLFVLDRNTWNYVTGCKLMKSDLFKMLPAIFSWTNNISYLPTPPLGQDMTQGQFLCGVLTGLNSEFSFS